MASTANRGIGQPQVLGVIALFGTYSHVTIDARHLRQLLVPGKLSKRTQVGLDLGNDLALVITRIRLGQESNFVDIGVNALAPSMHPARCHRLVAFDAFPARGNNVHGIGRRVEGMGVEVFAHGNGLPVLGESAFSRALLRIVIAFFERVK